MRTKSANNYCAQFLLRERKSNNGISSSSATPSLDTWSARIRKRRVPFIGNNDKLLEQGIGYSLRSWSAIQFRACGGGLGENIKISINTITISIISMKRLLGWVRIRNMTTRQLSIYRVGGGRTRMKWHVTN